MRLETFRMEVVRTRQTREVKVEEGNSCRPPNRHMSKKVKAYNEDKFIVSAEVVTASKKDMRLNGLRAIVRPHVKNVYLSEKRKEGLLKALPTREKIVGQYYSTSLAFLLARGPRNGRKNEIQEPMGYDPEEEECPCPPKIAFFGSGPDGCLPRGERHDRKQRGKSWP